MKAVYGIPGGTHERNKGNTFKDKKERICKKYFENAWHAQAYNK
jgi:hypothetical protein